MQAGEGAGAGVVVRRHRHRNLIFAQQFNRRPAGFVKEIERAGQEHRHGAAAAHRRHALWGQVFNMVGGQAFIAAH